MPFLKAEKERRIFHLAEMGYIDQEEVLKSLDYPNYEMVMQRMNERAAQQAQMQPPEPVK
jgi:hypothetical protein